MNHKSILGLRQTIHIINTEGCCPPDVYDCRDCGLHRMQRGGYSREECLSAAKENLDDCYTQEELFEALL